MITLNEWIEHVNTNENNIYAEVVEFLPGMHNIAVSVHGGYALDICTLYDTETGYTLLDLINTDIDTLELELSDGATSSIMAGVNPYGLIAYIKAVY